MTDKEIQQAAQAILNEMRKRKGGCARNISEKAEALFMAINSAYPCDMGKVKDEGGPHGQHSGNPRTKD